MIRDASQRSQLRPDGVNLGLEHINGSILWDFQPGMKLDHFFSRLHNLILTKPLPHMVIIHCGGNDIGQNSLSYIVNYLKYLMKELFTTYPNILFIWSGIIPRIAFRNEFNHSKLEKARKRINSSIGGFFIKNGGGYLQYPQIKESSPELFRDSAHLTDLGVDIMLNTLQGAIYTFATSSKRYFP